VAQELGGWVAHPRGILLALALPVDP
jgi:hypothetical protein